MPVSSIEAGRSYRLVRNFEVRDEHTGTMKSFLLRGTVIKVKKVAPEQDRAWIEGVAPPLPLGALGMHISESL